MYLQCPFCHQRVDEAKEFHACTECPEDQVFFLAMQEIKEEDNWVPDELPLDVNMEPYAKHAVCCICKSAMTFTIAEPNTSYICASCRQRASKFWEE